MVISHLEPQFRKFCLVPVFGTHHATIFIDLIAWRVFPDSINQRFFPDGFSLGTDHAWFWLDSFQWLTSPSFRFQFTWELSSGHQRRRSFTAVPSLTQNSCGGGYPKSVLFRVVYGQTFPGVGWGNVSISIPRMVPFTQRGLKEIVKVRQLQTPEGVNSCSHSAL